MWVVAASLYLCLRSSDVRPWPWPWGLGLDRILVIVKLHYSRQSQQAAQSHAPTPQEQLTNYLDKINHPAFDPDQSSALLLAVKEYEALKPLFRRLFCTPATSSSSETCIFNHRTYHAGTSGTHVQFIAGNSYVSEMQLWCVTVSSNELDQCAVWDITRRLDAVHDTNGLASYLIKSHDDTEETLTDFE